MRVQPHPPAMETLRIVPVEQAIHIDDMPPTEGVIVVSPGTNPARYFHESQKVSADIQSVAFNDWQTKHRASTIRYCEEVTAMTLESVHAIHQAESVRISENTSRQVLTQVEMATRATVEAASSTMYLESENTRLQQEIKAMNVKFHGTFGILMSQWDGTPVMAKAILVARDGTRPEV